MAPFDELQTLWQSQAAAPAREFDPLLLRREFHKFGRRHDIINFIKLLLIVAVLVRAIVVFRHSPFVLLSTTMVLFFAIIALVAEWRIQRGIAKLDFSAPSLHFVRGAIEHMKAQRNPFHRREYVILYGAILIGYNLITVALWDKLTVPRRISTHALATTFPLLLYALGRFVRAKRFNADYRPLIERLSMLHQRLEERAW